MTPAKTKSFTLSFMVFSYPISFNVFKIISLSIKPGCVLTSLPSLSIKARRPTPSHDPTTLSLVVVCSPMGRVVVRWWRSRSR